MRSITSSSPARFHSLRPLKRLLTHVSLCAAVTVALQSTPQPAEAALTPAAAAKILDYAQKTFAALTLVSEFGSGNDQLESLFAQQTQEVISAVRDKPLVGRATGVLQSFEEILRNATIPYYLGRLGGVHDDINLILNEIGSSMDGASGVSAHDLAPAYILMSAVKVNVIKFAAKVHNHSPDWVEIYQTMRYQTQRLYTLVGHPAAVRLSDGVRIDTIANSVLWKWNRYGGAFFTEQYAADCFGSGLKLESVRLECSLASRNFATSCSSSTLRYCRDVPVERSIYERKLGGATFAFETNLVVTTARQVIDATLPQLNEPVTDVVWGAVSLRTRWFEEYKAGDWDGDGRQTLAVQQWGCLLYYNDFDGILDGIRCFGNGNPLLWGDFDGKKGSDLAFQSGNCLHIDVNHDGSEDTIRCIGNGEPILIGDWDGNGKDDLAVQYGNCAYMDTTGDGLHDKLQCYGDGQPFIVGDWDGDGRDNLAVQDGNCAWFDKNFDGVGDKHRCFGDGERFFVGDFVGDGTSRLMVQKGHCAYATLDKIFTGHWGGLASLFQCFTW